MVRHVKYGVVSKLLKTAGLITMLIVSMPGKSQVTKPVSVSSILNPPYSVFVADYISDESNKFTVTAILNDLSEPEWNVKLRLTIESSGILLQSKANYTPVTPLTIYPGTPVTISGSELEPYFNYYNLDISGITRAELEQNGKLPEGYYTFCIEVLDYNSGKILSNKACAGAFIQLNGVPLVQIPGKGDVIMATDPQNMQFQWQLSTPSFYGDPMSTEYELALYEVINTEEDPANSIDNNNAQKIFESGFSPATTLVYGVNDPVLEEGKIYSFTIQAKDVEGRDIFLNNGFSETGWFYYGYPMGGTINLTMPEDEKAFTADEYKRFRWELPDNAISGQQISYHMKIVELDEGQDPLNAVTNNAIWFETTTAPQVSSFGGDITLTQEPQTLTKYAWQVKAFTGSQEIAASPAYIFQGPPLIDWFWAGNHKVVVTETENGDISHLSGKGKVNITEDEFFEFEFDSLQIVDAGGEYALMSGELFTDLTDYPDIDLTPNFQDNGNAVFHTQALKLNKDEMAMQGYVSWAFPHAVNSPDAPVVKSEICWINFDELKLNGKANLTNANQFELLDPAGFRIELDTLSDFFLIDNKYTLRFYGDIVLPSNTHGNNNAEVSVHFNYVDNLYYFSNDNVTCSNLIHLAENTGLYLEPKNIVLDLSETQSPPKFSGNTSWKGLFFDTFSIHFKQPFDAGQQFLLSQNYSYGFSSSDQLTECQVTADGLQLTAQSQITDACSFSTFGSEFTEFRVAVTQSSVQEGFVKGTIQVPLLKGDDKMAYTVPLTYNGFQAGYLDDNLQNFVVSLNPDKEKLHIDLIVKQAVFAENERLDLVVDLDWPGIQCYAENIDGLSVWGNQDIGYGEPNGVKALTTQLNGLYENSFEITIDSLVASRLGSDYLFGYIGTILLSDDISGDNGPSRFISGATREVSSDLPPSEETPSDRLLEFITEAKDQMLAAEINITIPLFYMNTPAVIAWGKLIIVHNDPDWGTAFYSVVEGKFKKPLHIDISCEFLLGKKDGTSYWFLEIAVTPKHMNDLNKKIPGKKTNFKALKKYADGIPVGPINIVGITGRVYHRMNNKVPVGIDCNMDFEEIPEPSDELLNIDLGSLPDLSLPDLDICSLLGLLDNTEKRDLLEEMSKEQFYAIMETMTFDDINSIKDYILQKDPTAGDAVNALMISYSLANDPDDFNYARIARLFPNIDWNDRLEQENYGGFQWSDLCNLNLTWPTIPSLCDLSEYLLNKVLGELPPPDYDVLENLDPDVDWVVIQAEYPEADWPSLREFFPDGGLCNLVMQYPNIDWGYIYLKVPELPKLPWPIDWNALLPSLPNLGDLIPDLDLSLPEIPDVMDMFGGDIDVGYDVDPSVSYGGYLGVDFEDKATSGITLKGNGSLEIIFEETGGLRSVGLQVNAYVLNVPLLGTFGYGLGCMSYVDANKQFVADLFAEVKDNPLLCAHGHMHMDISDQSFHINLASREKPVVIQPFCAAGPIRWEGFFDFNPNSFAAGLGVIVNTGARVSFEACDGCDVWAEASFGFYANMYASIYYNPEFYLDEVEVNIGLHAALRVGTDGWLCGDHSWTIASVSLDGSLRYKHKPNKNLKGTLSGSINFLDIITADVDMNLDVNL